MLVRQQRHVTGRSEGTAASRVAEPKATRGPYCKKVDPPTAYCPRCCFTMGPANTLPDHRGCRNCKQTSEAVRRMRERIARREKWGKDAGPQWPDLRP